MFPLPLVDRAPAVYLAGGLKRKPPGTRARAVAGPAGIRRRGWKAGSSKPDMVWREMGCRGRSPWSLGIPWRLNAGSASSPLSPMTLWC